MAIGTNYPGGFYPGQGFGGDESSTDVTCAIAVTAGAASCSISAVATLSQLGTVGPSPGGSADGWTPMPPRRRKKTPRVEPVPVPKPAVDAVVMVRAAPARVSILATVTPRPIEAAVQLRAGRPGFSAVAEMDTWAIEEDELLLVGAL